MSLRSADLTDLTVEENLEAAVSRYGRTRRIGREKAVRAVSQSGGDARPRGRAHERGEQQMLTIARTLMGNPRWCCSTSLGGAVAKNPGAHGRGDPGDEAGRRQHPGFRTELHFAKLISDAPISSSADASALAGR